MTKETRSGDHPIISLAERRGKKAWREQLRATVTWKNFVIFLVIAAPLTLAGVLSILLTKINRVEDIVVTKGVNITHNTTFVLPDANAPAKEYPPTFLDRVPESPVSYDRLQPKESFRALERAYDLARGAVQASDYRHLAMERQLREARDRLREAQERANAAEENAKIRIERLQAEADEAVKRIREDADRRIAEAEGKIRLPACTSERLDICKKRMLEKTGGDGDKAIKLCSITCRTAPPPVKKPTKR